MKDFKLTANKRSKQYEGQKFYKNYITKVQSREARRR